MKKVLSNNIAAGARQPYTKVTHKWYNAMVKELGESIFKSLTTGYSSQYIVLWGCINSDAPNADISAGAIWYNGEIYLCDAFVDSSIAGAIIGTLTTTYDASDPIMFTDNNSYNVHQEIKMVWSDGTSGTGTVDYADLLFAEIEGDYTPTLQFYDSSNALISSITSPSAVYYRFSIFDKELCLNVYLATFNTPANTNYIRVSLPVSVPSGKNFIGSAWADAYVSGGSNYNSFAFVRVNSGGAGDHFEIRRTAKTDYGAVSNLIVRFTIKMRIV